MVLRLFSSNSLTLSLSMTNWLTSVEGSAIAVDSSWSKAPTFDFVVSKASLRKELPICDIVGKQI